MSGSGSGSRRTVLIRVAVAGKVGARRQLGRVSVRRHAEVCLGQANTLSGAFSCSVVCLLVTYEVLLSQHVQCTRSVVRSSCSYKKAGGFLCLLTPLPPVSNRGHFTTERYARTHKWTSTYRLVSSCGLCGWFACAVVLAALWRTCYTKPLICQIC